MCFLVKPVLTSEAVATCGADYEPCSCFGGDTCVTYV